MPVEFSKIEECFRNFSRNIRRTNKIIDQLVKSPELNNLFMTLSQLESNLFLIMDTLENDDLVQLSLVANEDL